MYYGINYCFETVSTIERGVRVKSSPPHACTYSFAPGKHSDPDISESKRNQLQFFRRASDSDGGRRQVIRNLAASQKRCSQCLQRRYCSKKCADIDWRVGHKAQCAQLCAAAAQPTTAKAGKKNRRKR